MIIVSIDISEYSKLEYRNTKRHGELIRKTLGAIWVVIWKFTIIQCMYVYIYAMQRHQLWKCWTPFVDERRLSLLFLFLFFQIRLAVDLEHLESFIQKYTLIAIRLRTPNSADCVRSLLVHFTRCAKKKIPFDWKSIDSNTVVSATPHRINYKRSVIVGKLLQMQSAIIDSFIPPLLFVERHKIGADLNWQQGPISHTWMRSPLMLGLGLVLCLFCRLCEFVFTQPSIRWLLPFTHTHTLFVWCAKTK